MTAEHPGALPDKSSGRSSLAARFYPGVGAMKKSLALACVFLAACQVAPVRNLGPARLEIAPAPKGTSPGRIYSVNGVGAPDGPLLVAPGTLKLDFECPGQITIHGARSFVVALRSGKRYEFYCSDSEPSVRELP